MTQAPPDVRYDRAPMTSRMGDTLAPKYHYPNLAELAADLPPEARVLDVGAGFSTLGTEVCKLREDVEWTNADIQYGNAGDQAYADAYQYRREHKPANLHYEPADALSLTETFGTERFDRVFSYWMLPHIILASRELGVTAAENMLEVAKLSGTVAVGPVSRPIWTGDAIHNRAIEIKPATDAADRAAQADQIVATNTLTPVQAMIQRFLHKHIGAKRIESFGEPSAAGQATA